MSTLRGLSATLVLMLSIAACDKGETPKDTGKTGAAPAAKGAAAPADAKTITAFRAGNPTKGSQAKIHGYVGSTNGKAWPLVDKVGDTLPFVFCDMAAPPAGVAKGAHVVATGKVEDDAMLKECTVTPL